MKELFGQHRFFEFFIQAKGPNGVAMASIAEIQKNLKSFYNDLAYGNAVQEKYNQFLLSDPRVVQQAYIVAQNKINECTVIVQSMDCAAQMGIPITTLPEFRQIHNKYMMKANTYNVILQGLSGFMQTQDLSHLVGISIKLNTIMMRGAKLVI